MRKQVYLYILLGVCFLSLLTACSSNTTSLSTTVSANSSPQDPRLLDIYGPPPSAPLTDTLAAAATAPDLNTQREQQLQAIRYLILQGKSQTAQTLLTTIPVSALPAYLQSTRALLSAQVDLQLNQMDNAFQQLAGIETQGLSDKQAISFRRLMAAAYLRTKQYLPAIKERLQLAHLLTDSNLQTQNSQAIWDIIQRIERQQLQEYATNPEVANNPTLAGWIQLGIIAKTHTDTQNHLDDLIAALNTWHRNYPAHPALSILPKDAADLESGIVAVKHHIALLLPLHGPLKDASAAIRDGFMNAFYQGRSADPAKQDITIYDTSDANIIALYQKALAAGSNIIVGPLQRENVETLLQQQHILVPIIALNYGLSDTLSNPQIIQFGLSPLDEARATADQAWADGHAKALIFVPYGRWGSDVARAFEQQFRQDGGQIVGRLDYSGEPKSLANAIAKIMAVDQSEARVARVKRVINKPLSTIAKPRQDVDMIFMVATPSKARRIRPLLRYYYSGRLPIYALSAINSGVTMATDRNDLDNIIFSEIPWLLDQSDAAQVARGLAHENIPNADNTYLRLYALGLDAYRLSQQLPRLLKLGEFSIAGATGKLTLDKNNRVKRTMSWAILQNGKAKAR